LRVIGDMTRRFFSWIEGGRRGSNSIRDASLVMNS
jgi:hypothetical protein